MFKLKGVLAAPPIRWLRQRRYDRYFYSAGDGFPVRGVYATRAEARADVPHDARTDYDVDGSEDVHVDEMSQMAPSDYPVIHWLEPLLRDGLTIYDYGGHVGTKYRAFRPYLTYPGGLKWKVCDVPVVVEAGRRLAAEAGLTQLSFTTRFEDADGADVLIASGALQYMEEPLWTSLRTLRKPPQHLLINKLPWNEGPTFVTVQNAHIAFVPCTVHNREEFQRELRALGYRVVDQWSVLDRQMDIPFHPEIHVTFGGLYLRRD